MKPIKSPHMREGMAFDSTKYERGRKMAYEVQRWINANEYTFGFILATVKSLKVLGHKGRVRDRVAIECIRHNLKVGNDEYQFSNTLWAGISRYLVLIDPSLKDNPITFRDSEIDCYGLLPINCYPLEVD